MGSHATVSSFCTARSCSDRTFENASNRGVAFSRFTAVRASRIRPSQSRFPERHGGAVQIINHGPLKPWVARTVSSMGFLRPPHVRRWHVRGASAFARRLMTSRLYLDAGERWRLSLIEHLAVRYARISITSQFVEWRDSPLHLGLWTAASLSRQIHAHSLYQ
jgi:hypothetical protein